MITWKTRCETVRGILAVGFRDERFGIPPVRNFTDVSPNSRFLSGSNPLDEPETPPCTSREEDSLAPAQVDRSREACAMYKRQHYTLEHSARDSASSASSSSLDTDSDADSGSPEQVDDAAWPASSHESDESSPEEKVVEVESSASVSARRAEAIRIAERKLAEAAEDVGEFEESDKDDEGADASKNSRDEAEDSDSEVPYPHGRLLQAVRSSVAEPTEEALSDRKVLNQCVEAVEEDEIERKLQRFDGNTVICVGDENKVFKCRVCPKVICLNDETMLAHLASKRHLRSMKHLAEGKLKIQLDSDGDEEEDGETHAERYARTLEAAQQLKENAKKRKRDSGRQRQRNRCVVQKKSSEKSGTGVRSTATRKNREERRADLHAEKGAIRPGKAKTFIREHTDRKEDKLSNGAVKRKKKKKRIKQA